MLAEATKSAFEVHHLVALAVVTLPVLVFTVVCLKTPTATQVSGHLYRVVRLFTLIYYALAASGAVLQRRLRHPYGVRNSVPGPTNGEKRVRTFLWIVGHTLQGILKVSLSVDIAERWLTH